MSIGPGRVRGAFPIKVHQLLLSPHALLLVSQLEGAAPAETVRAGTDALLAVAASFPTAFSNGGPLVVISGWILASIANVLVAASLAEIASCYPLAGGPYFWCALLLPLYPGPKLRHSHPAFLYWQLSELQPPHPCTLPCFAEVGVPISHAADW